MYIRVYERVVENNISGDYLKNELRYVRKSILLDQAWKNQKSYRPRHRVKETSTEGKQIVYLDQNIFSMLLESDYNKADFPERIQLIYSPGHIEEIYKSDSDYHSKELDRLSHFTDNKIVLFQDGVARVLEEAPIYPYKRVKATVENTIIAEELKVLDAIKGEEMFPQYNTQKQRNIFNGQQSECFLEKFRDEVNEVLRVIGAGFELEDLKEKKFNDYWSINSKIHFLYEAMDMLGFKKDKIKNGNDRKVRSSRHDIEHILYAAFSDYFITADGNMYYRALNIFKALNRNSVVVKRVRSVEELMQVVNTFISP